MTHAFWLIHHTRMLTETDNNLSLQGKKMWRCVVCYVFVALTLKSLLSHIHVTHSRSPDFAELMAVPKNTVYTIHFGTTLNVVMRNTC